MSNEMISVPRELLERVVESGGYVPRREHLRALLAKPAEQHRGEPVAWRVQRVTPTGNHRLDRPLLTLATPEEWGPAWNAEPLYTRPAEQPAPAAVVMPKRKPIMRTSAPIQNARNAAWNACLDEVARLNPPQQ